MENKPILHVMMSKEVCKSWKAAQHVADSIKRVFGSKYEVIFTPNEGKGEEPTCTIIPDNSTIVNLTIDREIDMLELVDVLDKIPEKCSSNIDESPVTTDTKVISFQEVEVLKKQFSIIKDEVNHCIEVHVGTTGIKDDDKSVTLIDIMNIHNTSMGIETFGFGGYGGFKMLLNDNTKLDLAIAAFEFIADTLKKQRDHKEEEDVIPYNPNPVHGC